MDNSVLAKIIRERCEGMSGEMSVRVADCANHAFEEGLETLVRITDTVEVEIRGLALITAMQLMKLEIERELGIIQTTLKNRVDEIAR